MKVSSPPSQLRMRSSIACARCRRSKIKCVNAGTDTLCKACESSGRECVYPPPPISGSAGPKREGDAGERVEVKRQRVRKSEGQVPDKSTSNGPSVVKESERPLAESLDSSVLTPKVWQEVFDLFQLHFATDLPFLHGPTFLGPLCGAARMLSSSVAKTTPDSEQVERLPGYKMLLLGILALTARFHPGLIAYHSSVSRNKTNDPIIASEYYAIVLRALLVGERGVYIGQPNLEKVQALLMLGLHEWGICKGIKAWIHVGLAIRMAQAMGLQFDDDLDDEPWALSSAMRIEAQHLGVRSRREYPLDPASSEAFIDEEMRRRTFWSCFIMDRYLSSGKFRPAMLSIDDVRLQLPSSEHAFIFGERVCTNTISGNCSGSYDRVRRKSRVYASVKNRSEAWERERIGNNARSEEKELHDGDDDDHHIKIRCEFDADEGILSRFVRMVEIWGKIAKWSCAGGRRTEKHAPWNPRSKFYQMRHSLYKFNETMPRPFRFTQTNIQAHLAQRTSSAFTLLHILYSLCLIVLHREYVPFVPIRCEKPEGPLDNPATPEQSEMPSGFWEDSARQLFRAGRDIMDLVQACQSRGLLVETPILGFGLYTVAFVGVYAINFPHMDPDGYMCGKNGESEDVAGGHQAARKALEMIGQMRSRLPMANNWFRTIHRVHRYYEKIIKDYRASTQALQEGRDGPSLRRQLSLREGGIGGGNESYKLLEKTLKEFGSIEDEDVETMVGDRDRKVPRMPGNGQYTSDAQPKQEPHRSDNWTAINSTAKQEQASQISTSRGQAENHLAASDQPYYPAQPQSQPPRSHPQTQSNPPSLVSSGSTSTPTPSLPPASYYQRVAFHEPSPDPYTNHATLRSSAYSPYAHPMPHTHEHTLPPVQTQTQSQPQPQPQSQPRPQTQPQSQAHPQHYHQAHVQSPISPTPSTPPTHPPQSRPWNQEQQDLWLNSLLKPLGGDDVAVFIDGRSCEEWAQLHTPTLGGALGAEGWLCEVWGGGWGGS